MRKMLCLLSILLLATYCFGEEVVKTHTFTAPGTYNVTITATDARGASTVATTTVTVKGNQAPVVTIQATPTSGIAPLLVSFKAVATDPDGDVITYKWDFGDGTIALAPAPEHTYAYVGDYIAKVEVTDSKNNVGSDKENIKVGTGGCSR